MMMMFWPERECMLSEGVGRAMSLFKLTHEHTTYFPAQPLKFGFYGSIDGGNAEIEEHRVFFHQAPHWPEL